jgi:hypothetical protein
MAEDKVGREQEEQNKTKTLFRGLEFKLQLLSQKF